MFGIRSGKMRYKAFKINPYWMLILPLLLVIVQFYAYPILKVLWVSFTDPTPGLHNYQRLFTSGAIQRMLWRTLKICAITTFLSMFFGYIVAYMMTHVSNRHRLWMLLFILVPFWVSVLARAFSWLMLLHDGGLANTMLREMGFITEPIHLVRNQLGVVTGMVHFMVPYAILPLFANMQGIEQRLVTAARSLGAGPVRSFWYVFFPLSLPGIIGAGLLVFILSLGFFVTPAILGGGKTVMIAEYVSVQILQVARWGVGAMLAGVLLIFVGLLVVIMSRFINIREMFGAT